MTDAAGNQIGRRILVIGGAGAMGEVSCRALAQAEDVGLLLIGDRDIVKAEKLAAELGPGSTALQLDLLDSEALAKAAAQVDLVVNTAGPFYRFGVAVLQAAIDARTNYLDICDDWEPTLEMLELDEAARDAGITAVIGLGSSPGTSNLLAVLAMDQCETVERVYTVWRAGLPRWTPGDPEPEPSAAAEHWIHNCALPIKIWRDGALIDSQALEEVKVTFPGVGEDTVWVCGHPEPLTLPRVRPELRESLNLMTARRGVMAAMGRVSELVRSGDLDISAASVELQKSPNVSGSAAGPAPFLPSLCAIAEGTKDGRPIRVGARTGAIPLGSMAEATGYPVAAGALMMARGLVNQPGVHGPEGAIAPEPFFQILSQYVDAPAGDAQPYEVVSERFDD
jgi:saccharopine dehydrogenase-like NADP-dependent oxidoreductase